MARYSIACCAADALAATALVTGWAGPVLVRDSWVEVEGRFEPGDEVNPSPRRGVGDRHPDAGRPPTNDAQVPVIRFIGGLGTAPGRNEPKWATSASMSCAPPRALVPWLNTVKPSPPAARKLFIVTR